MQNELPEWCPQWAWDEAYRLASQVVAERCRRMETFQPMVARALVAAERRGIERAAEAAAKIGRPAGARDGDTYIPGTSADAVRAIRQLGEEP